MKPARRSGSGRDGAAACGKLDDAHAEERSLLSEEEIRGAWPAPAVDGVVGERVLAAGEEHTR